MYQQHNRHKENVIQKLIGIPKFGVGNIKLLKFQEKKEIYQIFKLN